jgi:ParB family chromosome partitioning protein
VSAPKRGLGRGLDALLGQRPTISRGQTEIRVDAIRPNPQQPRKAFDATALAELEQSIRELGVLVPIIVRPVPASDDDAGETFELIAGERRWRAAAAARVETIPAIVRVENLQRRDLDPLEEAMSFQHLIDDYGFTAERLAERIGKSRPAVSNALRLLNLPDPIKALLRNGSISVGHARALLAIDPREQVALAGRIVREGLTVRDIERQRERRRGAGERKAGPVLDPTPQSADRHALEGRLRYMFGAPVVIVGERSGGRIEIRYADDADLGRIVDALLANEA